MYKRSILESLHICLKIPIIVLDDRLNTIRIYPMDIKDTLNDRLKQFLRDSCCQNCFSPFKLLCLSANSLLAVYRYQKHLIIFGPFLSNYPLETALPLVQTERLPQEYLSVHNHFKLPHVNNISHLLHLIHYFFTGHLPSLKSEHKDLSQKNNSILHNNLSKQEMKASNDIEDKHIIDESLLLDCMKSGNLKDVKQFLQRQFTKTKDPRSEKNYSILIFEKISQFAISMGISRQFAHDTRDDYIEKYEQCQSVHEVLQLRESAVLLFTQKISGVNKHSYTVSRILHYIQENISKRLLIRTIAREVNFSESNIRKLFKKEMKCSIQQYIRQQKIEQAKLLLRHGISVTEVSINLGYSDAAHFSKTFKTIVGISPKQYQQKPQREIC
ncbi:YSIRK-targeted surface antigen transcriptional regulator [Streptococcus catagoni]|uniref:YSIRK-targeted surface antigen transcriptional regulator n=1 Tax=Streptococcus catagoni TaxID=2654874 RepID=UPI00140A9EA8|nr:YSIRK-targeted surface antigen transcriptional regulator [Streptococcus catagoni]